MYCADRRLWNFPPLYKAIGGETLKACCHRIVLTDRYAVAGSGEPPAVQEPQVAPDLARSVLSIMEYRWSTRVSEDELCTSSFSTLWCWAHVQDLLNNCDVQRSPKGSARPSTAAQSSSQSEKCSWKPLRQRLSQTRDSPFSVTSERGVLFWSYHQSHFEDPGHSSCNCRGCVSPSEAGFTTYHDLNVHVQNTN